MMKLRRICAVAILVALSGLVSVAPAHSAPQIVAQGGLEYTFDPDNQAAGATVTGRSTMPSHLVIPSTITHEGIDYTVVAIADQALHGINYNGTLTSVTIPGTVTHIGASAFYQHESLTSVTLGNGVQVIGDYAFSTGVPTWTGMTGTLNIPDSVTTIGAQAFGDNSFSSVNFGSGIQSIANGAFVNNNISSLTFPASVQSIGASAFADNPVASVTFQGDAPDLGVWGALGGTAPLPTVTFYAGADGFTTPTWNGGGSINYPSRGLATVTFDSNGLGGPPPSPVEVEMGTTLAQPADLSQTGYTFTGWWTAPDGGSAYDFDTPITGNTTLYAQWVINTYDVTWDFNDNATSPHIDNVEHGTEIDPLPDPSRTGYTFTGWWTAPDGGSAYDFDTPITGNTTLYAQWSINTYTVTFHPENGDVMTIISDVEHGTAIEVPDPARVGYAFTGWWTEPDNGNEFDLITPITGNTTLYAQWSINTYDVTWDFNDNATSPHIDNVEHGTEIDPLPDPSRTGYTFTGWWTAPDGGTAYDFDTPITGNTTLYAQWAINTYTVTFHPENGDVTTIITDVEHGTAIEVPDPARVGYAFTGWWTEPDNGNEFDLITPITRDIDLFAQWERIPLHLDAPTVVNPGDTVTISGSHFLPVGVELEVWMLSNHTLLTTVNVGIDGTFTATATIPTEATAGVHHIEIRMGSDVLLSHELVVEVLDAEGDLADTGVNVATSVLVAIALLGLGLFLIRFSRSHR